MQKQMVEIAAIKIIGPKIRTNYQAESSFTTSKIGPHVGRYVAENMALQIPARKQPGVTIVTYSNYSSNEYDEYDCFIGEEVTEFEKVPVDLNMLTIPAGRYLKFTTEPGEIPRVVIEAWQRIWELTKNNQLGEERNYQVDFEVYDQRTRDLRNAVLDIYVGIKT